MKRIILVCIGGLLIGSSAFSQGFYKLHWYDEFNENELNMSRWDYQLGTGASEGLTDWGNDEQQYYTNQNAVVKDGFLTITAKKETYNNKPYTSSRLFTRGKYHTTYGRIEARISLSPAVQGLWPAFWMLPQDSPYGTWAASGEIDIFEGKGRLPGEYSGAIHYGGVWPKNTYATTGDYTFANDQTLEDFHIYALEWKEGELTWYCDNRPVKKITQWHSENGNFPAPFDTDFYILLNLAVGGTFDGYKTPPEDFTSAEMKVDYVRVYKWDDTLTEPEIPDQEAGTISVSSDDISIDQTSDEIRIKSANDIKTAGLYTADGRLCARLENLNTIKTSHLNKGYYVLAIQDRQGHSRNFKVMVK